MAYDPYRHLCGQHGYICIPNCQSPERFDCQEPGQCRFERDLIPTPVEFFQDVPEPKIIRTKIPLPSRESKITPPNPPNSNMILKLPPIKKAK